jgi:hypothetical protein
VFRSGKRWALYLLVAVAIISAGAWYFSTVAECTEADTGRCDVGAGAVLVTVLVLGLLMPVVMFFGEMTAWERRRRNSPAE